jgi:molecular chaperone DnaK
MIKEAEQYAEEDRKRREAAELRNQADTLVYQTEKFLADNPDTVPADVKSEVERDIAEVKKALEGDDTSALKAAFDKLSASRTKIGQAIYANAQQNAASSGSSETTSQETPVDGDVVEGEVVEDDQRDQKSS